jgi:hypothetical protein
MANTRTAPVRSNIKLNYLPQKLQRAPAIHAPLHGVVAKADSVINQFRWLNRPAVLIQHE